MARHGLEPAYVATEGLDIVDYLWYRREVLGEADDGVEEIADVLQFFVNAGGYGKNLRVIGRAQRMKVLFSALHLAYFRNFESVVRELAARGHQVHLVGRRAGGLRRPGAGRAAAAEYPSVTWGLDAVARRASRGSRCAPDARGARLRARSSIRATRPPKLRLRNRARAARSSAG